MTETEISKEKICFKCGEAKLVTEFYKHPQMGDGRLNKCKACTKKDVSKNYRENREYYAEYEQQRYQDPGRRQRTIEYQKKTRGRNPEKYQAKTAVGNAVRDGRLSKKPCELCGEQETEAHHPDYSKPLEVQWVCRSCHLMLHGKQAYNFEHPVTPDETLNFEG